MPRSVDSSAIDDQQQVLNDVIVPSATHNPATASTMRGQVGTVQTIQLRPSPAAGTAVGATNNGIANKSSPNTTMRTNLRTGNEFNTTKGPNVMQFPTSTEICRQVHELRRHNEELRRRVDVMQKEKEDMLLRIERLEQLVLIRDSDTEMKYVDM